MLLPKKVLITVVSLLLVAALFAACAGQPATPPAGQAPAGQPAAGQALAGPAGPAPDWPGNRTVSMVIPYSPGGGNDTVARLIAQNFNERHGNMVATNITGASGQIGSQHVIDAAPDGFTILINDTNTDKQYVQGMADFSVDIWGGYFIVALADFQALFMTRWDTIEEMIEWAHANPGQLTFGVGIGQYSEMAAAGFFQEFNIDGRIIDVGDTGGQLTSLAGGHVDLIIVPVGQARDYIALGEFNIAAFFRQERAAEFPDIPTLIELGGPDWLIMPRYHYIGITPGTDPAIVAQLGVVLEEIVTEQSFIDALAVLELQAVFKNAEESQAYVEFTRDAWYKYNLAIQNVMGRN